MIEHALPRFRILMVPRFGTDEFDVRAYDSLIGQRALWNALVFQIVHKHKASVELRISSDHNRSGLDVSLGFHGIETPSKALDDLRQVQALLPSEYLWSEDFPVPEAGDAEWRVARVVRKLEYIDLPALSPEMLRSSGLRLRPSQAVSSSQARRETASVETSIAAQALDTASLRGKPLKELPLPTAVGSDLNSRRYVMPLPGQIDEARPRQRTLYQEILDCDDAVVSFCFHPFDEEFIDLARIHALSWKRFLDPFAQDIESSGFAEVQHLRASYDRYSLPASYLSNISIRVAARSDEHSVGLANVVAAYLGGARAFRVFPPTRDSPIGVVTKKDVDIPSSRWDHSRITAARRQMTNLLADQSVDRPLDDDILDFLALMPHVYTIEEAERVLRLPIADEEGLPGLESRLIPPFTVPSRDFLPAVDRSGRLAEGPEGRVRLGLLTRSRSSAIANDGIATYSGKAWHSIDQIDLTKHALIVGSTGSGKTLTTLFLVRELNRIEVPFLIIEPVKTEYNDHLKKFNRTKYLRYRFEGAMDGSPADDFLSFDPMRLQEGVTVARHASYLKSCFEAAFPLDQVSALIFEAGIRGYYTDSLNNGGCGLKLFDRGSPKTNFIRELEGRHPNGEKLTIRAVFPSLVTFGSYFLKRHMATVVRPPPGQTKLGDKAAELLENWRQIFQRRFEALLGGMIGLSAKRADERFREDASAYDTLNEIFLQNTIIELDGIPDDEQKSLMMSFLMTALFERRQADDFERRQNAPESRVPLKHVLVVEEAHRVLTNVGRSRGGELAGADAKARAVSLFVDMLAEIRALGEGIVIVEQIPTKIVPEAIKNTNLKIMLRLTSKEDREYLGEAMNFSEEQKRFVTNLRVDKDGGINMVVFEEGIDNPILLSLPIYNEQFFQMEYDANGNNEEPAVL